MEEILQPDFLKLPPEKTLASLEGMLKSLEGVAGDGNQGVTSMIFKIGKLHLANQHDQAYVLFEQWVPKVKAAFGPEEPATFEMISKTAELFLNTGAERKVIPVLEECLLKLRTKRGDDDPATLATLNNLVQAFISTGQAEKAVPLLESRRAWLKDRGRAKGDDYVRAAEGLTHAYWSLGDFAKTAEMEREVVAWARTRNPPDPEYLAAWLESLGRSLMAMDRAGEAEPVMRESLAIREKTNPNQWDHHTGRLGLGIALHRQKKFVEAEALLLAGYEGMTKAGAAIPLGGEDWLTAGADTLVELYTAMGSTEAAGNWRPSGRSIRSSPRRRGQGRIDRLTSTQRVVRLRGHTSHLPGPLPSPGGPHPCCTACSDCGGTSDPRLRHGDDRIGTSPSPPAGVPGGPSVPATFTVNTAARRRDPRRRQAVAPRGDHRGQQPRRGRRDRPAGRRLQDRPRRGGRGRQRHRRLRHHRHGDHPGGRRGPHRHRRPAARPGLRRVRHRPEFDQGRAAGADGPQRERDRPRRGRPGRQREPGRARLRRDREPGVRRPAAASPTGPRPGRGTSSWSAPPWPATSRARTAAASPSAGIQRRSPSRTARSGATSPAASAAASTPTRRR